ncbi:MAG: DUF455 family protein [Anaerolineales bacterium]|nr:DUF455 family protein [Anaerolineales bacterium]
MTGQSFLHGARARARLMRYDTAVILKRFFFCQRALILGQAGWLAALAPLELKTILPRLFWQDAMTADAQRARVFELRYPSRLMEVEDEQPLVQLLDETINAPSALAYIWALTEVLKPALLTAYQAYLDMADVLGDGPSLRFMDLAAREQAEHIAFLREQLPELLAADPAGRPAAEAWVAAVRERLEALGGIGLDPVEALPVPFEPLPGRQFFALAQAPARDARFNFARYYWPDVIDPAYPYGEGLSLQLRSAVSHLNEVWAVETGGAILQAFAEPLGWEFILDAARWTYDESRHCRMGLQRLTDWGFTPAEMPLGSYIYDAARDQDPIYRLGMLYFFETKNIRRKPERVKKFTSYGDDVSRHDMDFDWADETIHAAYGTRWLTKLLEVRGESAPDPQVVRARCGEFVDQIVRAATNADRAHIRQIAEAMTAKAERLAAVKD